jgi:hypothetical protein
MDETESRIMNQKVADIVVTTEKNRDLPRRRSELEDLRYPGLDCYRP